MTLVSDELLVEMLTIYTLRMLSMLAIVHTQMGPRMSCEAWLFAIRLLWM